ncbi:MAG: hypothetical protein ACI4KN_03100, partial [Gemmiger sp.]
APLTALGCAAAWLTAAGMGDWLFPGMVVLYLAFVGLGIWALLPRGGKRPDLRKLLTPGALLFWGMSAAFAVYFSVRQPMATGYDELSLWATAVKVTKMDNRLYSTATLGTPWPVTQNPGLPLLSYFFQFFGHYADWKIYLAYDVLAFAAFAAVLGGIEFKQYRTAVPLAAACWAAPWFLTTYNHTIYLNTTYMTAYGDVSAGLVLGGAVALWLALRRTDGPRWAVLPVLALAANIKANTFVLSLVAAGLVAVDAWLFAEKPFRKGLVRRTGFALCSFAAPMAIYYFWNVRYVSMLVARSASEGGTGETSTPLASVVVNGIKILLGQPVEGFYAERQPQFEQAMADMGHQFWTADGKLSMIGQGRNVVIFILLIFALAVFAAGSARLRTRISVMGVLSVGCFAGYNLMLALSYGFIFKPDQAAGLVDYNRYIYTYYIGWFLMALACLSLALQENTSAVCEQNAPAERWNKLAAQGALLGIVALMLVRVNSMVLPQLSVMGFSDSEFADRKAARQEAEWVSGYLSQDDRVFYVSQGDNGEGWFSAVFDFYPILVDYSGVGATQEGGGGTFGLAELEPEEGVKQRYYHPYTAQRFDETVRGNGCTVLFLQKIDDIFVQSYGDLFTDHLQAALDGQTVLYRVTAQGYAPMEMEAAQ